MTTVLPRFLTAGAIVIALVASSVLATPAASAVGTPVGQPTNVIAVGGPSSAKITWTAAAANGNSNLVYGVTASPQDNESISTCLNISVAICTITGLTNGTSYSFSVTATSLGLGGAAVVSNSVVPAAQVPSLSTPNIAPVPRVGNAKSFVTIPTSTYSANDSAITLYTVKASPGGRTCTYAPTSPPPTGCTVTGLTNGTPYTFTMTATNLIGTSVPSAASVAVTPINGFAPGTPTVPTAVALYHGAKVSWTASAVVTNTPVTFYVSMSTTNAALGSTTQKCVTTVASCYVAGLTPGTSYYFKVYASDAIGSSISSAYSAALLPSTITAKPIAPGDAIASGKTASVTVSWSAPIVDGGLAITAYTVTSIPGSKKCTTTGATSCTVSALTNGTAYKFTITATNSKGTSLAATTGSATPSTAPSAPTRVRVVGGIGSIKVSWTLSTNNGGVAIDKYVVCSTGGLACISQGPCATTTATTTSCVISGLSPSICYTPTVFAHNINNFSSGQAAGTAPSCANPLVPAAPGAPTGVTAVAGNRKATVSWLAPSSIGTSAISSYSVTPIMGEVAGTSITCTTALTCVITGLINGTAYTFKVVATNGQGTSSLSAPSPATTPATSPGAPTTVTAVAGNTQATVSWTAPASDGGRPITSYTVTPRAGTTAKTPVLCTGALSCVITGLVNGTAYTFTVTAKTAFGASVASLASASAITPHTTAPGAPTAVVATRGNVSATVSFTVPTSTGGVAISSYTVTAIDATSSGRGGQTAVGASSPIVIAGLTNGDSYTFTVTAKNSVGTGLASVASVAVIPATNPQAPTSVVATRANVSASVAFSAPSSDGGLAITTYTVTATDLTNAGRGGQTATGASSPIVVTGLTNGDSYTFTVTATNPVGASPASSASVAVTPATVAGAPTGVTATQPWFTHNNLDVSWVAPTANGGLVVTSYLVTAVDVTNGSDASNGASCSVATVAPALTPLTTCKVSSLTAGHRYTLSVVAINGAGSSLPSVASSLSAAL
jgi:hypothetical protein